MAADYEALLNFLYAAPHGMAQFDVDGVIDMLNPAFACLVMPLLPAGEQFNNIVEVLGPFFPDLRHLLASTAELGLVCDGVRLHLGPARPGQDPRVLALTVVRTNLSRYMAVLADVSSQVAQERRLRDSEAWFNALVLGADDYTMCCVTPDGRIADWNASGERLFGLTAEQALGGFAYELIATSGSQAQAFLARLGMADRHGWHMDEGWRTGAGGRKFWGSCIISPLSLPPAETDRHAALSQAQYLVIIRDVTAQRQSAEDLRRALTTDALTGILNRRTFLECAERDIACSVRDGTVCCLAMIDADHFKAINDTHGHAMGDTVLQSLADALRAETRETDLVGRLGGEEFAILLPGTDPATATRVAARLLARVRRISAGNRAVNITVSIGLSRSKSLDFKQMLQDADAALYAAKRSGRDCLRWAECIDTAEAAAAPPSPPARLATAGN